MRKQVASNVNNMTNVHRKSRQSQRRTPTNRVVLEKVLGITITNSSGLTCDPSSGLIAYPAGCVIVLLHPKENKQSHIINTSRKTFTALAFSQDGKYLVTGESGHLPCVRVWDVSERSQVAELQSHKHGVACVAFSANSSYIVSVGYQHDMTVIVWEWRKGTVIASNKVSSKVLAVSFSEDNSYFVTAGKRHIKFWYLNASKERRVNSTVPLIGRSGLLGDHKDSLFCSLACGRGSRASSTYCIVGSGLLCLFNSSRELEAWVDLKTTSARCLAVSESYIFCGCANGTVRVFSPLNLKYITTLHRPHCLGMDITQGLQSGHLFTAKPDAEYPDTLALTFDPVSRQLTCVYNDHSVYVWDVRDFRSVGKLYSAMYHSSCVWSVETYPEQVEASRACLPAGTFLTSSSDNTIRLWHGDPLLGQSRPPGPGPLPNIYSNDLLRVVYVGQDTQHLQCEAEPGEAAGMDGKAGIRVMVVSPDGQHLAAGDRSGNLHIFGLQFMDEMEKIEAHDSEVLCLEFSPRETGLHLLASASRDRLIHIFNMERSYSLEQTIYDHSASITAIKFTGVSPEVHMVSCGADKSIYFRTAEQTSEGLNFSRSHHVVEKTTLYDMDLDGTQTHTAIACQDRNIRVYNVESGKMKRCFKGSTSEEGTLLKVQMDPSGMYLATSCSDKNICIFDYESGECMATLFGHSEIVTCMRFSQDCRYLITVSGDSCVFVWKLDSQMTTTMTKKLAERRQRAGLQTTSRPPDVRYARRETFTVPFSQLTQPVVVVEEEEEEDEAGLGEERLQQQEEEEEEEEDDTKTPCRPDLTFDFGPPVLESNGKLPMWFRKLEAAAGGLSVRPPADPQPVPQPPRSCWLDQAKPLVLPMYAVLTPSPMRPEEDQEDDEDDPHFHPQSLDSLLGGEEEEEEEDQKTQLLAEDEKRFANTRPSPPDCSDYILYPANSTVLSTGGEGEFDVQVLEEVQHQEQPEELSPDSACCMAPPEAQDQPQDDTDSLSQVSSTGSSGVEDEEEEKETLLRHHFETMANGQASEEVFEMDLRSLQPAPEERHFLNPRLSISTRFLSRFQGRLRVGLGPSLPPLALPPRISEETSNTSSSNASSSNTSSSLNDTEVASNVKSNSCPKDFTTESSRKEHDNVVVVRCNSVAARRLTTSTAANHRRSYPRPRQLQRRNTVCVLPRRHRLGDITDKALVPQSSSQNILPQLQHGPANHAQKGPLTSLDKNALSRLTRQSYMGTTASSRAKKAPVDSSTGDGLNIDEQQLSGKLSSAQDLSPDLESKENLPPESPSSSVDPGLLNALPPSWSSSVEPGLLNALPPSWSSSVEPGLLNALPPSWSSSVEPGLRDALSLSPGNHGARAALHLDLSFSDRPAPLGSSISPLSSHKAQLQRRPLDSPRRPATVTPTEMRSLDSPRRPAMVTPTEMRSLDSPRRPAMVTPTEMCSLVSPCRPAMVTPTEMRSLDSPRRPLDSPRLPAMVTPTEMRSLGKEGRRRISSIEASLITRGRATSLAHATSPQGASPARLTESLTGGHSAGGPERREAGGHQDGDMLSSQPSGLCSSPLSGASASLPEGSGEQSNSSNTGSGEEPVNLQVCHQVISDLKRSMRTAVDLYQKVGAMTGGREQRLLTSILTDAFSAVQTDMSSVLPAGSEPGGGQLRDDGTLALLEKYSDMLLQITERKMDCK